MVSKIGKGSRMARCHGLHIAVICAQPTPDFPHITLEPTLGGAPKRNKKGKSKKDWQR